jgi:hypothetical protein
VASVSFVTKSVDGGRQDSVDFFGEVTDVLFSRTCHPPLALATRKRAQKTPEAALRV